MWIGLLLMDMAICLAVAGIASVQIALISVAVIIFFVAMGVLTLIPERLLVISVCTVTVSITLFAFLKLFVDLTAG